MVEKKPENRYPDGPTMARSIPPPRLRIGIFILVTSLMVTPYIALNLQQVDEVPNSVKSPLNPAMQQSPPEQVEVAHRGWYSKPRIYSVIPFDHGGESHAFFSEKIINFITAADYELVERQVIMGIIDELKLNQTQYVSKENAVRIGQLAGAHIIITGNISSYKDREIINVRAFDVETSEVLGSSEINVADTNVAITALMDRIASRLVYRSVVVSRDNEQVKLQHGKLYGAIPGMKLRVLNTEDEMIGMLEVLKVGNDTTSAKIIVDNRSNIIGLRVEEVKE